jgi:peptidyl-prolyl cis-trans isomerase SurA
MKLGTFRSAAIVLVASLLSAVSTAQTGSGTGQTGLNIPQNLQVIGRQDPSVRKATAIVNGDVITETDVDHRLALIAASNDAPIPPEELQRIRAQVLRNLVDERLQIQAAAQREIIVTPAEIQTYFERYAQSFQRPVPEFAAYLRSIGSSEQSIKQQIRAELAWQRLQRRQIEPFVSVGDEEVQSIIERLTASRGTREFKVSEIFISATPENAAEARASATRIVQQIRTGASFPAYARQYSEASTAAVGGDLGWVRTEQLPEELARIIPSMEVGAVSDPIPLPGGFSILGVADTRQILVADPRDAVLSLIQMTVEFAPGTTREQATARAELLGRTAQSMGGCGRAAEAAATLGAEIVSNDQVPARNLPPALQEMLLSMNVGQATRPVGSLENRVSVFVLCGRDDPQTAEAPTFDDVYRRLNEERVTRRAQRFLRDLRRDAVVDYR